MNRKKLIALIIAAGVFLIGAGIGTYAWFTSRANSAAKTFTSGTMVINVNGKTGGTKPAEFDIPFAENTNNIKPGDILTAGADGISTITIKNTGTLPMVTLGRFTAFDEDQAAKLSDVMLIDEYKIEHKMTDGSSISTKTFVSDGAVVDDGLPGDSSFKKGATVTLRNLVDMQDPFGNVSGWNIDGLKKGEEMIISFKLKMDPNAGDKYQGKTANIGYEVNATQPDTNAITNLGLSELGTDDNTTAAITAAINYVK